jgi:hypothetical protein
VLSLKSALRRKLSTFAHWTSCSHNEETSVKKYRRIEITAFRRRVTVTAGGSHLNGSGGQQAAPVEEGVWLNDADSGAAIEVASDEGQLILADAVRSLERRLSAQGRATLCAAPEPNSARRSRVSRSLYAKLYWLNHFIIRPKFLRATPKEK